METFNVPFLILAGTAVLGASIETFFPGFLSDKFKSDASSITIGLLGIVFSTLLLMVFLKFRIREGFEDTSVSSEWTSLVNTNKIPDVCKLYTDMYEKMMVVEKGAPPEPVKTDAQAREAVDKQFSENMTVSPVSCSSFEEVNSKKDNLDEFFTIIQKLPDIFLVQVFETAVACRTLLIGQYLKVQQAEQERKEGFQSPPICSETAAKEKKEFQQRNTLSEEAQKCMLLEEVPVEQKVKVIRDKLQKIQDTFTNYKNTAKVKDSFEKILSDAQYYKGELDKKKQQAEATSNQYNW